jgi:hypothetical protein
MQLECHILARVTFQSCFAGKKKFLKKDAHTIQRKDKGGNTT